MIMKKIAFKKQTYLVLPLTFTVTGCRECNKKSRASQDFLKFSIFKDGQFVNNFPYKYFAACL